MDKFELIDIIELESGDVVYCRDINIKELKELKDKFVKSFEKYKDEFGVMIHQLENGQFLVHNDSTAVVYDDFEDIDRVASNGVRDSYLLENKNPFGKDFPIHTHELIHQLLIDLNINPEQKMGYQLLKSIDIKLSEFEENKRKKNDFVRIHLIHLIALVGETLKKKYAVEWVMHLQKDQLTWTPCLITKGNQKIDFIVWLYEDLTTNNKAINALEESYKVCEFLINKES